jgi:hypothetical protein
MSNRYGRPWNSSKHSVRRDGMTHLICGICGTEGPPHASNVEARKCLADDGWSRCYTGSADQLRCPDCRATRTPGSNQHTSGSFTGWECVCGHVNPGHRVGCNNCGRFRAKGEAS